MVCEICDGRDLVKTDGVYTCSNCGAKFSAEEAKKLLVDLDEPTNDAPEQAPAEDRVNQILLEARELFEKGEYKKAGALYETVEDETTSAWQDTFFPACCKACSCNTTEIPEYLRAVANMSQDVPPSIFYEWLDMEACLPVYLDYYRHWLNVNKRQIRFLRTVSRNVHTDEARQLYTNTAMYCYGVQISLAENWLTNPELTEYTNVPSFIDPLIDMVKELYDEMDVLFSDMYDETLPTATSKQALSELLSTWTNTFLCTNGLYPFMQKKIPGYIHSAEKKLSDRIQYLEEHPELSRNTQSGGGCYVATAVYGSYDCPQVWTLRRFRDHTLAQTWYGRAFIYTYYAISPTLVRLFGETRWFKEIWQPILDRMVKTLNTKGVEDTPYEDRSW